MSTTAQHPRIHASHRVWRWLRYGTLGLAGVAALAAAGGAWWLWGWRVGSLHFHESWSPEQWVELAAFDADLLSYVEKQNEMMDAALAAMEEKEKAFEAAEAAPPFEQFALLIMNTVLLKQHPEAALPRWLRHLSTAIRERAQLAPHRRALKEAAESGRGDVVSRLDAAWSMPLVHVLCRAGRLGLVQEFVLRGANPNGTHFNIPPGESVPQETLFQTAILCEPWVPFATRPPLEQRLELLEFLLAHGASPAPHPENGISTTTYAATLAYHARKEGFSEDGPRMLEWLLEHGLTPEERNSYTAILLSLLRDDLPTAQRLLEKGFLSSALTHNPSAIKQLLKDTTDAAQSKKQRKRALQSLHLLDLLLAHGAKLEHPEQYTPTEETLRQEYTKVINKYRLPLPTH